MMNRAVTALLLLLGATTPAWAYVCTAVPGAGHTLWWEPRNIPIVQHVACSLDVPDEAACKAAVTAAMQAWTDVPCTDFTFVDVGDTTNPRAGYDWRRPDDNHNVVVFREGTGDPQDAWPHTPGALAITTVTFNSRTGRILDADIEVNGAVRGQNQYTFGACNVDGSDCAGKQDIQNTLTHEFGHVLGLDHPMERDATMYGSAEPGELKKRSLEDDDRAGICTIYPNGQVSTPCTPAEVSDLPEPTFKQVEACDDTGLDPCGQRFGLGCSSGGMPGWFSLVCCMMVLRRRGAAHARR